jgi:hypothetical protein
VIYRPATAGRDVVHGQNAPVTAGLPRAALIGDGRVASVA